MPINLICSCGLRQSVRNATAGLTLTCSCGKVISVPTLDILRQRKAEARAAFSPEPDYDAPPDRSGRRVLLAAAGLLVLIGLVGWVAWLASHPRPATQIAQGDERRRSPEEPGDSPRRQTLPDQRNQSEPTQPEPGRVETPTKPPAKPIPIVDPGEKPEPVVEPVKPVVEPPRPKEPPPLPMEVKPPAPPPEGRLLVWRLKEGETFYQEVTVTQKPSFSVQGLPVQLVLRYQVVSRFTVRKINEDGSRVVEQKIESAKILEADDLTQAGVAGPVAALPGTTYTLHLSPKMDVTRFEGADAQPGVKPLPGGQGMQMTSLVDRDGWKELAQMTFFQMDQPPTPKARWSKPLTHNWGALGSWAGQTQYEYLGRQGDVHKIGYALKLTYKAPAAGAVVGGMQITAANFQPQQAVGLLSFDAARGKVVVAEERFRVKGVLTASILGQQTAIEMEEDQHFLIRILEK
jgi:hypothetical protein